MVQIFGLTSGWHQEVRRGCRVERNDFQRAAEYKEKGDDEGDEDFEYDDEDMTEAEVAERDWLALPTSDTFQQLARYQSAAGRHFDKVLATLHEVQRRRQEQKSAGRRTSEAT